MSLESKAYFPIKIYDRKSNNNRYTLRSIEAYSFTKIDIVTNKLDGIDSNSSFNFNNFTYENDIYKISNETKVLVYEDKENNLYGVVAYASAHRLFWIPKDILTESEAKDRKIINFGIKNNIIQVDEEFEYSYKSDNGHVHRCTKLSFSPNSGMSVKEFQEALGLCVSSESSNNKKTLKEITEEILCEEIKEKGKNIESIVSTLVDKEIELDLIDSELNEKRISLYKKEKELNELEYNLTKTSVVTPKENLGDAEIIYEPIEDMVVKSETIAKSTYDLIFKVLQKGDCITIPFNVFKEFTVIVKSGALERNANYTKYVHIALIKVDKTHKNGILAMIDVDVDKDAKISVLEKYGLHNITQQKIFEYENNYRQWKRDRSFII